MNVKQFKEEFDKLAAGVPQEGASGGQWRRVVKLVAALDEPVTPKPKQTTKPKTKDE